MALVDEDLVSRPRARPESLLSFATVAAVAVAATVLWAGIVLETSPTAPTGACAGCPPYAFALLNESRAPPGSPACFATTGEVCYAFELVSEVAGLRLVNLSFVMVAASSTGSDYPGGPPARLGSGARVSALGQQEAIVGSWNWSEGAWVFGGSWEVPVDSNTTLVLDAGLQNVSLVGDTLWLLSPGGAIGMPVD